MTYSNDMQVANAHVRIDASFRPFELFNGSACLVAERLPSRGDRGELFAISNRLGLIRQIGSGRWGHRGHGTRS